jgi:hypothetical protein
MYVYILDTTVDYVFQPCLLIRLDDSYSYSKANKNAIRTSCTYECGSISEGMKERFRGILLYKVTGLTR